MRGEGGCPWQWEGRQGLRLLKLPASGLER